LAQLTNWEAFDYEDVPRTANSRDDVYGRVCGAQNLIGDSGLTGRKILGPILCPQLRLQPGIPEIGSSLSMCQLWAQMKRHDEWVWNNAAKNLSLRDRSKYPRHWNSEASRSTLKRHNEPTQPSFGLQCRYRCLMTYYFEGVLNF
jgi:hypothetical protein